MTFIFDAIVDVKTSSSPAQTVISAQTLVHVIASPTGSICTAFAAVLAWHRYSLEEPGKSATAQLQLFSGVVLLK